MITLKNIVKTFLKVGLIGFGGGAGMLAIIRSECVKKKGLITDDELTTAVAIGQMLPGPFVPNYCEYIGYCLRGLKGAIAAGVSLLLPSFIIMLVLSYLYFTFHTIPAIEQVFRGIGAVMTAIILWAGLDMGKLIINRLNRLLIFTISLILFLKRFDPVLTVFLAGILNIILEQVKSPKVFLTVPLFLFDLKKTLELFGIFLKIGAVIFGGGYAAIPFIQNEVCVYRNWLTRKEFLDGFALGQITPGPVAITATFVGFKVMGIIGAFISTIGIFLPSFLMLIGLLKIYKRIEGNRYVDSFLNGIKSAVVAILISTGIFFIPANWSNPAYGIFGILCLCALFLIRKIEPLFLIIAGVLFGILVG
jgi:chromate transporter|uniref:Chromate efflux transporter n=1 Tax=candidate division WOR-3 bacterium TaxID=2052148 RepID=A0A7V3RFS2_UNCW3